MMCVQLVALFKRKKVNGDVFIGITDEMLQVEFAIKDKMLRSRIIRDKHLLFKAEVGV
jgi:hypothetical protein